MEELHDSRSTLDRTVRRNLSACQDTRLLVVPFVTRKRKRVLAADTRLPVAGENPTWLQQMTNEDFFIFCAEMWEKVHDCDGAFQLRSSCFSEGAKYVFINIATAIKYQSGIEIALQYDEIEPM